MKLKTRQAYCARRHRRLRQKVAGSAQRPRLSVYVSRRHMTVQFVDDSAAVTLAAISTQAREWAAKNDCATAQRLGTEAAALAREKGIESVVFDRGGRKYAGRVKAIAEAVRAAGIKV